MTRLVFEILSFWQVATGAGQMGGFDSRPARDPAGLPVIPGRQVKGLCRQAMLDAEGIGKVDKGTTNWLFGTRAAPGEPLPGDPTPARLRFTNACLPESDHAVLQGQPGLIAGLYRSRRSTAISANGTAVPHSLRHDEIVIPLTLEAEVMLLPDSSAAAQSAQSPTENWESLLCIALPLLNTLGSGRTRGMGRVIATMTITEGEQ